MNIRGCTPDDLELLKQWMREDPEHQHLVPEAFVNEPNTELLACDDEDGVVMFARLSQALRVDVQFAPGQKTRTGKMLVQSFGWLKHMAKERGIREIIFDTVYEPLMKFMSRLGFQKSVEEWIYRG